MAKGKRILGARRRYQAIQYEGDTVLIVCEGKKTEPSYLNALKEFLRLNTAAVEIAPSSGSAPSTVVKYAKQEIVKACKKGNPYTKVYCVIGAVRNFVSLR